MHTRGWWVLSFIPRHPKSPLFPNCLFNWWAELLIAAYSERPKERIDVKLYCLPRCTRPYGRPLTTQNCACLFTDPEPCKGDTLPCLVTVGSPQHAAWDDGAVRRHISKEARGVCSTISCKCCMKERRVSTIPGFSGPYKFSTCFHWVVQYVPRMSRCVWGTVNSNKWRHGDNHGKSMVKRANTISLLAGAK